MKNWRRPWKLLIVTAFAALTAFAETSAIPISGPALPGLEPVDATMTSLMAKYATPGAQLAVTYRGRLVLAHGYGLADRATGATVQADSRFRIASLSKLITAAAILTLIEQGKLTLDAKAFALLPHLRPGPRATTDPRLADITVRHLLQHSGGWDRGVSGDPMFKPLEIAEATKTAAPADAHAVIQHMLGQALDFNPGSKSVYSNFGYNVLGRIIEAVSGRSYGDFVQENLLGPAGVTGFALGRSLAEDRAAGEVAYFSPPNARPVPSVFPIGNKSVLPPYGGFHLEAMDAHGAWITTATDYVRLLAALDGSRSPALLTGASLELLTARPAPPVSVATETYYGLGIQVRPVNGATGSGANWWHSGSLPGTATYMVRLARGWSWAAFFNSRPSELRPMQAELDRRLNATLVALTAPATGDLFAPTRTATSNQP